MNEVNGGAAYAGFLMEIKARIRRGQYQALRAANKELLELHWDIGEAIHRRQESLDWAKRSSKHWPRTCAGSFQDATGFPRVTYGT